MAKALRRGALVAIAVCCVAALAACTSDGDLEGESSFRNLGKRGETDLSASRSGATLR